MTQIKIAALAACLLLTLAAMPAVSQETPEKVAKEEAKAEAKEAMKSPQGPAAGAYLRNLAFVGGRTIELAEAIPADKYGWRPMEGVRSVSESLMHMAGANFFFAKRLGEVEFPEGMDVQKLEEEVTGKEKCLAVLRQSIEHLEKGLAAIEDLHAEADVFGRPGTVEDLTLISISHVHEHFGQLIAYARSNQVVPPWSQ